MLTVGTATAVPRRFFRAVGIGILVAGVISVGIVMRTRNLFAYEYGYYTWEKDETQELIRWTSAEATSLLRVRGNILEFKLRQLNPDLLKRPYQVKLFLDDRLLDTIALSDTGWKDCKYFLPLVKEQDLVKLRIVPESTFVPLKFGNDTRKLGVEVRRFAWQCSLPPTPIGVYERENEKFFSYYWTGSQASFPIQQSVSRISFFLLPNYSVLKSPISVSLFWNNLPLKKVLLERLQWSRVELEVPQSTQGVLTIQVLQTINPRRSGQ